VYARGADLRGEVRTALLATGFDPFALDGEALARAEAELRRGGRANLRWPTCRACAYPWRYPPPPPGDA
jgi:hypothetical protein